MPTATETSAPKAAAKPKPAPKKPAGEGAAKKQEPAKTSATIEGPVAATEKQGDNKKAAEKKRTTSGGEKKRTTSGSGEKKMTTSGSGEKKRTTSGSGEKKRTVSGGEKKRTTSGSDKKQASDKKGPADKKTPVAKKQVEEVDDEPAPAPIFVPKLPVAVPVLNTLEWASCAKVLENLLDFTTSLGAALAHRRPFTSAQHLINELNLALDGVPASYIEVFLKRFNELPLIPKNKLTKEHKCCVGLDKLTDDQKAELTSLCAQYREKFGFPFVVCAREANAAELPVMLRSRMLNDKDQELECGRKEAKKIARLRLAEVVVA